MSKNVRKRKRLQPDESVDDPRGVRSPSPLDNTKQLSSIIKLWNLPYLAAYELVNFCEILRPTTTVQIAGSGVVLLTGVLPSTQSIRSAAASTLGGRVMFTLFSDVQLTTKLKYGYQAGKGEPDRPNTVPAVVYVRIDVTAKQRRELDDWMVSPYLKGQPANALARVTKLLDARGAVPTGIGLLRNVQEMRLEYMSLTGPLPSTIGRLTRMRNMYLCSCLLTGRIPSEIGRLTLLQRLEMDTNNFTGPIPTELGCLTNLTFLFLGGCEQDPRRLTGHLPATLGRLVQLRQLKIETTALSGQLPSELGSLHRLEDLVIENHVLVGPVPSELRRLTKLRRLNYRTFRGVFNLY